MKEKQSLTRVTAGRYQKANKREKGRILDEFIKATGYTRCYGSNVLSRHGRALWADSNTRIIGDASKGVRYKREPVYGPEVAEALKVVWMNLDFLCGKRLKAVLIETVWVLEKWKEIDVSAETKQQLHQISAATIDRLLAPERQRIQLKSRSGTKPGTLLKHQVAVRTFAQWDEARPGFVEVDLVSHSGGDERGDFCQTLCVTDVSSGWTEAQAVKNKARVWVLQALREIQQRLPFKLLGIDSDNGGEFINHHLIAYCNDQNITFTRSRAYRKNDNCFVEEKNYTVVRKAVGYMRHDTPAELEILNRLYFYLRLRTNYFLPSMKLAEKQRFGSKVVKRYHLPETPCRRLLGSTNLSRRDKQQLRSQYLELNPAQLTREISRLQQALLKAVQKKSRKTADKWKKRSDRPTEHGFSQA